MTLIGVIMGTGFAAATYMAKYQTAAAASKEHAVLKKATEKVDQKAEELREEVEELQFVSVRVEISQRQIQDQLRIVTLQNRRRITGRDLREMNDLERRTRKRGEALEKSYRQHPVIKPGKVKMSPKDPLAKAEEL